jgi:hypothetical protein
MRRVLDRCSANRTYPLHAATACRNHTNNLYLAVTIHAVLDLIWIDSLNVYDKKVVSVIGKGLYAKLIGLTCCIISNFLANGYFKVT